MPGSDDTLAVTGSRDSLAMNRPERSRSNAANALIQVDCPWCADSVRATDQELADGLACFACSVVVQLESVPIAAHHPITVPVAA